MYDVVRKISPNGQVFINEDGLRHANLKEGDYFIMRFDSGKHGNFISVFQAKQKRHLEMIEEEKQKNNQQ